MLSKLGFMRDDLNHGDLANCLVNRIDKLFEKGKLDDNEDGILASDQLMHAKLWFDLTFKKDCQKQISHLLALKMKREAVISKSQHRVAGFIKNVTNEPFIEEAVIGEVLRVDIFFPEKKTGVEFDGPEHNDSGHRYFSDDPKTRILEEIFGIKVLRINHTEFDYKLMNDKERNDFIKNLLVHHGIPLKSKSKTEAKPKNSLSVKNYFSQLPMNEELPNIEYNLSTFSHDQNPKKCENKHNTKKQHKTNSNLNLFSQTPPTDAPKKVRRPVERTCMDYVGFLMVLTTFGLFLYTIYLLTSPPTNEEGQNFKFKR